MTANRKKE